MPPTVLQMLEIHLQPELCMEPIGTAYSYGNDGAGELGGSIIGLNPSTVMIPTIGGSVALTLNTAAPEYCTPNIIILTLFQMNISNKIDVL